MKGLQKLKNSFALALTLGMMISPVFLNAFAQTQPAAQCASEPVGRCPVPPTQTTNNLGVASQGVTPAIEGRVLNEDVIDTESRGFVQRIRDNLVHRPAPEPGMTRGEIEAIWGDSQANFLAPGKDKEIAIYVNDTELIDGYWIPRNIGPKGLKVYEVRYCPGTCENDKGYPPNNAKALSVKPLFMPRVGDHVNLYTLLLKSPIQKGPNVAYYSIPQHRVRYYRDITNNAFDLVRVNMDTQGYVIGQEFISGMLPAATYSFTSARRYVEQPTLHNFNPASSAR